MTGLVGWWPLHRTVGDAVDLSGEGNDGTITGATRGVAGRGGLQAFSFDGTDDHVEASPPVIFESGESFTISFWFRQIDTDRASWFSTQIGANLEGVIVQGDGSQNTNFFLEDGTTRTQIGGPFSLNEWVHLVAVWDGTDTAQVYKNGSLQDETTTSFTGVTTQNPVRFGARADNLQYLNGSITDFRLYDRPLSAAEVERLYEWGGADIAEPPSDLDDADAVSYWPLDEDPASTSTVSDAWGSNDGTINGATQADPAVRGTGLSFGGSDNYVNIPHNIADVFDSPHTIAFWLNMDSESGDSRFPFAFGGASSDAITPRFKVRDGTNNNAILYQILDESSTFHTATADGAYSVGDWIHVCGVRDNEGMKLYINAVVEGKNTHTGTANTTDSDDIQLGGGIYNNFEGQVDGDMDDVRIYSRALDPAEIHEVYRWGTRGRDLRKEVVRA